MRAYMLALIEIFKKGYLKRNCIWFQAAEIKECGQGLGKCYSFRFQSRNLYWSAISRLLAALRLCVRLGRCCVDRIALWDCFDDEF